MLSFKELSNINLDPMIHKCHLTKILQLQVSLIIIKNLHLLNGKLFYVDHYL